MKATVQTIAICLCYSLLLSDYSIGGTTLQEVGSINKLTIDTDKEAGTISPEIYGHFAEHLGRCIYEGLWVGPDSEIPNVDGIRKDILEALRQLNIPVLRWPGGCFADEYHWKDGIGPRAQRPSIVNTHWGMVTEDNSFGTHEFLTLCELLGCEAYIAGNVGSGTPEEMMDWVEYMTFDGDSEMARLRRANGRDKPWKVKYFGVGNENWGCGGNMRPEYYADVYKRYQTYVKSYPGNRVTKIACGAVGRDTNWTEVVMQLAHEKMDAISLHYYVKTGYGDTKGSATEFTEKEWFTLMDNTLKLRDLLNKHIEIMDKYDEKKRIGLFVDEWGTWWNPYPGSNPNFLYQQNSLRDAVSAGIFLNEFNLRCDRVRMANIAQTVNVLQAMILTEGSKMLLTPTYHVFEMYKVHQGARLLESKLSCNAYESDGKKLPSLHVSASKAADGMIHVTLCNLNPTTPSEVECELSGASPKTAAGRVLTAETMNAHNTFENPNQVTPKVLENIKLQSNKIVLTLPAKSVVALSIQLAEP